MPRVLGRVSASGLAKRSRAFRMGLPTPYLYHPYCGAPPSPQTLLHRWNLDPILVAALLLAAAAYAIAVTGRAPRSRQAMVYCGWAVAAAAVISPLCPLSVSLFSARVTQHMLLAFVAAPLIASGLAPKPNVRSRAWRLTLERPLTAATAFTVVFWAWHAPALYTATFESDGVYWLMHASVFGSGLWLWSALLYGARSNLPGFLGASLIAGGQMAPLGAALAFAQRAFYAPHLLTTQIWGLTPLEDQAIGGAIMWVPGGIVIAISTGYAFVAALARAEARARERLA